MGVKVAPSSLNHQIIWYSIGLRRIDSRWRAIARMTILKGLDIGPVSVIRDELHGNRYRRDVATK